MNHDSDFLSKRGPAARPRPRLAAAWLSVGLAIAVGAGGALRGGRVAAQAPRAEPARRVRMEYRQEQATWTQIADTLNRWESRGWEAFEIVPIQPQNPGAGNPMTVVLVLRRVSR
jgi:hypothetical protein